MASDEDVLPMAPIADNREPRSSTSFDHWAGSAYRARPVAGTESSVTPPPLTRPSPSVAPSASATSRRVAPLWALFAAIALIAAAAIGWLARANLGSPVAAPVASVVLPAPPQQSRTLPPVTATVPDIAKPAQPQAATPAPSTAGGQNAVELDRAWSNPSQRLRNFAPVAAARPKITHEANLKRHARPGTRRTWWQRRNDQRAFNRQHAPARSAVPSRVASNAGGNATRASSLNCRRARNDVTAAICSDANLAALDRQLTSRFAALDRSSDPVTVQRIHHGETNFLNARQSCRDRACIAASYRKRLRELGEVRN
nr:hypothetical protein [Polymorphobacter sp.]